MIELCVIFVLMPAVLLSVGQPVLYVIAEVYLVGIGFLAVPYLIHRSWIRGLLERDGFHLQSFRLFMGLGRGPGPMARWWESRCVYEGALVDESGETIDSYFVIQGAFFALWCPQMIYYLPEDINDGKRRRVRDFASNLQLYAEASTADVDEGDDSDES